MTRVAVVGSFDVDHVWTSERLPRPGETLGGRYATGPGGKGFNQATAARRAGAQTVFICALGDDDGGRLARRLAQADGIDLRARDSDQPTGTAGIYLDAAGSNSIVIGAGANADRAPAFVAARGEDLAAAAVALAQLESPVGSVLLALLLARAAGATTLLNPAPANATCPPELLAATDLLTPNETEFATLLGAHTAERIDADAVAGLDDDALHRLCRTLLPHGTVVVTLGAAGAFVSHPDGSLRGDGLARYRLPAETVATIDTTGAGDAFNGALAASLAGSPGQPFAASVRFAACYAAPSTARAGAADAMPHAHEVAARYPAG